MPERERERELKRKKKKVVLNPIPSQVLTFLQSFMLLNVPRTHTSLRRRLVTPHDPRRVPPTVFISHRLQKEGERDR